VNLFRKIGVVASANHVLNSGDRDPAFPQVGVKVGVIFALSPEMKKA
jgi:hypothetical protein